jgi:hypothetical protein
MRFPSNHPVRSIRNSNAFACLPSCMHDRLIKYEIRDPEIVYGEKMQKVLQECVYRGAEYVQ